MLDFKQEERITAKQILQHPFLTELSTSKSVSIDDLMEDYISSDDESTSTSIVSISNSTSINPKVLDVDTGNF